jgi:hypothetical protein
MAAPSPLPPAETVTMTATCAGSTIPPDGGLGLCKPRNGFLVHRGEDWIQTDVARGPITYPPLVILRAHGRN